MRYIIVISLEELRKLEQGRVIETNINGIKTQIVCTDNINEVSTILDLEEKSKLKGENNE